MTFDPCSRGLPGGEGVSRAGSDVPEQPRHAPLSGVRQSAALLLLVPRGWALHLGQRRETQTRCAACSPPLASRRAFSPAHSTSCAQERSCTSPACSRWTRACTCARARISAAPTGVGRRSLSRVRPLPSHQTTPLSGLFALNSASCFCRRPIKSHRGDGGGAPSSDGQGGLQHQLHLHGQEQGSLSGSSERAQLPATSSRVLFVSPQSPAYTLVWTRLGNGKLPSRAMDFNGILTIRNVQPEDAGVYVCTGSNMLAMDEGRASLYVPGW